MGVLSFTLVLITGALLAWQRGELKRERHRLPVAAGWEEPSSTDDLDSTGEETGAGFTPAESGGAGHIVRCDACGAKNRLSRASAGHTCGKCGADLLGEDTVVEAKPIIPKSQPDAPKQRHPALEALANPVLQGGMAAVGLVFAVYQTAGSS